MRFKHLIKNLNKKGTGENQNTDTPLQNPPPPVEPQVTTPQQLIYLQKNIGNQALGELMAKNKTETTPPAPSKSGSGLTAASLQAADSPKGKTTRRAFKAEIPAATGVGKELKEGEFISFPDVNISDIIDDAIAGNIAYTSSMTQSGSPGAGKFGLTSCSISLSGLGATLSAGTYTVTGTLSNTITYCVCASTGPGGQKNIASETDSNITAANYTIVVSDLTPNLTDLGGRPPRTQFWSRALTL